MNPRQTFHFSIASIAFFLLNLVLTINLAAATNIVRLTDFAFTPATVRINVGDTILWTNAQGSHNVVCEIVSPICGRRTTVSPGWTYAFTFPTNGNFRHRCEPHSSANFSSGMTNLIIVNALPSVSLTNPVTGTLFNAPATIQLKASATDADGTVTNVQFFRNFVSIGNKTSAPFDLTISNLAAGNYIFTAQARDNSGATNTSAAITVSVITNATIASSKLTNGNYQLSINAVTGLTYVVQSSTNLALTNWFSLFTNVATNTPFSFVDTNAYQFTNRFYRIRSQ